MGGAVGRRRIDLLSLIPLVAIVALVVMVGALVWAVNRSEADQARIKLATDALWVEQTLRFQLSIDEDMLARLALDAAGGTPPQALDARARLHIATNPEMLSVVWYDGAGRPARAMPSLADSGNAALLALMQASPARSARPIYGDLDGDANVAMGLRLGAMRALSSPRSRCR